MHNLCLNTIWVNRLAFVLYLKPKVYNVKYNKDNHSYKDFKITRYFFRIFYIFFFVLYLHSKISDNSTISSVSSIFLFSSPIVVFGTISNATIQEPFKRFFDLCLVPSCSFYRSANSVYLCNNYKKILSFFVFNFFNNRINFKYDQFEIYLISTEFQGISHDINESPYLLI